uniref:C-type lectin domain-containing protein n=1 Tax=Seriola lalandi dorsalis TaxID=1841481 RepID=A0A3B4Z665_SERLL
MHGQNIMSKGAKMIDYKLDILLNIYNYSLEKLKIIIIISLLMSEILKVFLSNITDHNFQQGWVYFYPSFYYISSTKKSWHDSRDDCLQRGADLVIINKIGLISVAYRLLKFHKTTWIGLSDRETEGIWKWVDGTPMTKSYWARGEPNSYEGKNEDCVEIRYPDEEKNWNDIPCEDQRFWICEKTTAL